MPVKNSNIGWRAEEEKEIRESLCELAKNKILESEFTHGPEAKAKQTPIHCSLEVALRSLLVMDELDALDSDFRRKLVDRVNVILRSCKPCGLNLEASQCVGKTEIP